MGCKVIKRLPELCDIKTGKKDANHAVPNGKYRFYTCASSFSLCNTYSFSGPSIIVPGNGDIGLAFFYDGEFEAYQRTYVLSNITINPKYLYYHLCYKWRDSNSNKQYGSTVRYIRMTNFLSYEVPVPSLSEQERIVAQIEELLSELEAGQEALQKIKQQLAVYRQAVIEDAVMKANKEDEKRVLFQTVVTSYQNGISKRQGEGTLTPVLRLADIENQHISCNNGFREIGLSDSEREKYILNAGDLLIIRVNGSEENVGRAIVVSEQGMYSACDHFIRCILDKNAILPEFAQIALNSYSSRKHIKSNMVSTAGQNTVSQGTISSVMINLPSLEKQSVIVREVQNRLSICDNIERTVEQSLQQSAAMRQSILKQAFEGGL